MIAALVTGGLATLGTAIVFLVMFLEIRDAERRCADARTDAANKAGQIAIAASDVATQKGRADAEKTRADALDDLLAKADSAGPVDGAYERLLQAYRTHRADTAAAAGAAARAVSQARAAAAAGSVDLRLVRPGEDP